MTFVIFVAVIAILLCLWGAPPVTSRTVPVGYKLPEGFKSALAPSLRPGINFWETELAPAGASVPEIDISSQHNTTWRQKWISALKESKPVPMVGGYDPDEMDNIIFLLGAQSGSFTIHAPQNTKYAYWGAMSDLTFQPWRAGQFPLLNATWTVTNYDPTTRTEAGPSVTTAAGTGV